MTAVLLAALSGLSYGASDFSGALASKEDDATVVTVAVQSVSLAALALIVAVAGADATTTDLAWGALGGLGGGAGLALFYRALAIGPMSTAASLTALISAAVPVVAGLALGDRPSAITLLGVSLAVPAAVLVAAGGGSLHGAPIAAPRERVAARRVGRRTPVLSVLAGFGFGLFFIALSRASEDAGLFPLVSARAASVMALSAFLLGRRSFVRVSRGSWTVVGIAGILDCAANSFYVIALRYGTFTWVAAISSLYPVSTVLLARVFLDERLTRVQVGGLALAGGALVLVAVGA